jgi:chromosome segregation ATPase
VDVTVLLAVALVALGAWVVFLVRGHAEQVAQLKRDIEAVEVHNRNVENDNTRLKAEGASLAVKLKEREEAQAKLEQSCAALESRLAALAVEKEELERRTRSFQGEWDRQITTLEEEIQTVVRQLGEFRRGTRLPLSPVPETGRVKAPGS